jgi:hypothetical protein
LFSFDLVARTISSKLDQEYELFEQVKSVTSLKASKIQTSRLSASRSLSRSSSSQNIGTEDCIEDIQLPKIEIVLHKLALESAKDGGIKELLGQTEEAQHKYIFAMFLLQAITKPSDFAPITSKFAQISIEDCEQLNRLFDKIQERIS